MKRVWSFMGIVMFMVAITSLSGTSAQWPLYSGSLFTPASSFFNSPYGNYFSPGFSPFPGSGFRGLENYGTYVTGGVNNLYTYNNFGLYGTNGLYPGLPNYNPFSPGIFSPFISQAYMNPLSLGQWNVPSPWPGSTFTAGNVWPGVTNIRSMPYPGGQYTYPYPSPYPSPYPRTSSGLTVIRTNTDGLLEERIRDALGLGAHEPITTEKALTLTSLDASDMCYEQKILISPPGVWMFGGGATHEIKCEPDIDLSMLEEFTNLTELDLRRNTIDDFSPLAKLTNLEKLILHTTNIKDISALAGLTRLTELNIHRTGVSDISPLAGLTNLEILKLHSCKIEDISLLANLTNLQELILDNNQVNDVGPLAGLVNLKILLLGNNEIRDLSPLLSLTNLEKVELPGDALDNGDCPVIEELRSQGASVMIWDSDDLECK